MRKAIMTGGFTSFFSTLCIALASLGCAPQMGDEAPGGAGGHSNTDPNVETIDCGDHGSIGSCGPISDDCYCAGSSCYNPAEGEYLCIFRCETDAQCDFVALGTQYGTCSHFPDGTGYCLPGSPSSSPSTTTTGPGSPTTTSETTSTGPGGGTCTGGSDSCTACTSQACCPETVACDDNPACVALISCGNACHGDVTCEQNCYPTYPGGVQAMEALWSCLESNCATACGG